MLNQIPKDFRKLFLLKFTKELIENSIPTDVLKLKKILNEKEEELEEKEKKKKKYIKQEIKEAERQLKMRPFPKSPPLRQPILQPVRIPAPRLPPRFNYLKPTPINQEINLGKLNPLVTDPAVKEIQCLGANQEIYVITNNRIKTKIILTKEEIDEVIQKFVKESKIPSQQGPYRVVVGKLILEAMLSEKGSTFTIKKMLIRTPYKRY